MLASSTPRVTVLTAVKNGERYLDQTIASIIDQSFLDFEYIIINDGSTDATAAILAKWAARDARIRLLHNERSLNPSGALNHGLSIARGEYVANIDHDDLAYPTRLAEQVAYLESNPSVGVVGSQVIRIDEEGKEFGVSAYPTQPALAKWCIFFQTPVLHSAAMMRRALVEQVGNYSLTSWMAGDYELFSRISLVAEISNLPTALAAYRRSSTQISSVNNRHQTGYVLLFLQAFLLANYGFDKRLVPAIAALYYGVRGNLLEDESRLVAAGALLAKLHVAFVANTVLRAEDAQAIAEDCARRFLWMAWTHRRLFRATSRTLLTHGLELDPNLWHRSQSGKMLRALYRKEIARTLEPAS